MSNRLVAEFSEYLISINLDPRAFALSIDADEINRYLANFPDDVSKRMTRSDMRATTSGSPILQYLLDLILEYFSKTKDQSDISDLIFFEFPFRDVNAHVMGFPSGNVIIVQRGLFSFFSKFSKLVLSLQSVCGSGPNGFRISDMEQFSSRLTHLALMLPGFLNIPNKRIPDRETVDRVAKYYSWPIEQVNLRNDFIVGMEIFILFHEIGHIVCGHVTEGRPDFIISSSGISSKSRRAHVQEFEADQHSFERVLDFLGRESTIGYFEYVFALAESNYDSSSGRVRESLEKLGEDGRHNVSKHNPELFFMGITSFFYIAEMLEMTAEVHGISLPDTHPSPRERRKQLIENLERISPHNRKELTKGVVDIIELFDNIMPTIKKILIHTKDVNTNAEDYWSGMG